MDGWWRCGQEESQVAVSVATNLKRPLSKDNVAVCWHKCYQLSTEQNKIETTYIVLQGEINM